MIPITITEFFDELESLTLNKFRNTTPQQKLRYLNRALLNLHVDLKSMLRGSYDKASALSLSNGVASLPSDMNKDDTTDYALFQDENRTMRIPTADVRWEGDALRFPLASNDSIYIEYTREPNRYTDIGATLEESASVRALEMLQSEVEYIRDVDIRQGQISGQAQAARIRTKEIS